MVFSKTELGFAKAIYWLATLSAHIFICYKLFTSSRALAGILWLLCGLTLIFVMYFVFFQPGPSNSWPPYLSSCPDYLTNIGPNACVDYVGLDSVLRKSDPKHPPNPTNADYVFNSSGTIQEKANKAIQYGLTWEGVTN